MTLHQALRDYHTRSIPKPREPVRGLRRIPCEDGAADHFIGQDTRTQYFRLYKASGTYWVEVVQA